MKLNALALKEVLSPYGLPGTYGVGGCHFLYPTPGSTANSRDLGTPTAFMWGLHEEINSFKDGKWRKAMVI